MMSTRTKLALAGQPDGEAASFKSGQEYQDYQRLKVLFPAPADTTMLGICVVGALFDEGHGWQCLRGKHINAYPIERDKEDFCVLFATGSNAVAIENVKRRLFGLANPPNDWQQRLGIFIVTYGDISLRVGNLPFEQFLTGYAVASNRPNFSPLLIPQGANHNHLQIWGLNVGQPVDWWESYKKRAQRSAKAADGQRDAEILMLFCLQSMPSQFKRMLVLDSLPPCDTCVYALSQLAMNMQEAALVIGFPSVNTTASHCTSFKCRSSASRDFLDSLKEAEVQKDLIWAGFSNSWNCPIL